MKRTYASLFLLLVLAAVPFAKSFIIVNASPFHVNGQITFCKIMPLQKECTSPQSFSLIPGQSVTITKPTYPVGNKTASYMASSITVNVPARTLGNNLKQEEKSVTREVIQLDARGPIKTIVIYADHHQTFVNNTLMVRGLAIYNLIQ